MNINYLQDTDTLHIELCPEEVSERRNFDENTSLGLDSEGRICAITIKHASDRIDLSSLKSKEEVAKGALNLSHDEQGWLDEYRRQLQERFPGLVEDIFIYGPYARGISDLDVEMNVLVLIREGDRKTEEGVTYLGHTIDMDGFFVGPSIMVYSKEEWAERERNGSPIYQRVIGEGISVL